MVPGQTPGKSPPQQTGTKHSPMWQLDVYSTKKLFCPPPQSAVCEQAVLAVQSTTQTEKTKEAVTSFLSRTDSSYLLGNVSAGRQQQGEGDSAERAAVSQRRETTLSLTTSIDTRRARDSPRKDDHEVHYIPTVAEVGAFVKSKAQGNDLNGSLKTEYSNKVGLCVILQRNREFWREHETHRRPFFWEVMKHYMKGMRVCKRNKNRKDEVSFRVNMSTEKRAAFQ